MTCYIQVFLVSDFISKVHNEAIIFFFILRIGNNAYNNMQLVVILEQLLKGFPTILIVVSKVLRLSVLENA